jgi:hypothetical protein
MNELLTSLPIVVLTGAGASKSLGKATTYDIYECPEFVQRCGVSPFNVLRELHDMLAQAPNLRDPPDLELLLDYMLDVMGKFDALHVNTHFQSGVRQAESTRELYAEAYEQALDFMVDYYGNIDREMAAALYRPFLDGLRDILGTSFIPIFTLNYDEAVESAIDELPEYRLLDGFRPGHRPVWSREQFDRFSAPPDHAVDVVLFKLHGSVCWTRSSGSERIEKTVLVPRRRPGREHILLYPTRLGKAIHREPFATAYAFLEAALKNARLAIFIGTSFRDAELLHVIRRCSNRRSPFTLMAVGPKVEKRRVGSMTDFAPGFVRAVRLSFEARDIPALLAEIRRVLSAA